MDLLDHRKLGESLDLFHFEQDAPGVVFWHPRGQALYRAVEEHVRRHIMLDGYQEVRSPVMLPLGMWKRSGHWDLYQENIFSLAPKESRPVAIKPMNCPGHVALFNHGVRSWRDLPLRMAEFGLCHRNEPSGSLHGLLRLRSFVQDDGHIFCMPEQVNQEVIRFCCLLKRVYSDFGFDEVQVAMSLRPSVRLGSDGDWDRAEALLLAAAKAAGLSPEPIPGEGAFYGPKLEFSLKDRQGRSWQCGTLQLDLLLPEKLGARYRDAAEGRSIPVLLHRAILGSLERFVGILLEHHGRDLPFWLAPDQVAVLPVRERNNAYAEEVFSSIVEAGFRARLHSGDDMLSSKIKAAENLRIPAIVVVGDREARERSVSVRQNGSSLSVALSDLSQHFRSPSS